MRGVLKLSTPKALLVKLGMPNCAENCSGHGECHNGTCVCEVMSPIVLSIDLVSLKFSGMSFIVQYFSPPDSI